MMSRSTHEREDPEVEHALSTYLNTTGPCEYNLPSGIGINQIEGTKKTAPMASFHQRTKLSYHPECAKEFQGKDAPPMTSYSPEIT